MRYKIITYIILLIFTSLSWSASHHPNAFLQKIRGEDQEGEAIVQHFCSNCHSANPLIPLGAPQIANKNDWEFRLKKGSNLLFMHTQEGLNAMPPRGGCFECTDKQLLLAIIAMLPVTYQKSFISDLKDYNKYN
ncbi:Cytochrome c5 (plasmid) [Legionella adelaidensis]|uniref:Cytochrome c5 n=1 Tax=Legionella adelaidensis TaxID=45056 RepID=A0A0W0R4B5_9GAMM|nr:c-type cytochrome [Legionella adelaidensis]KTC65921.1 cytochrome c5 [Legionella adelaidensis]VEH85541.1 Cytochrome c5 [Legionella adelaidensis]